MLGRQMSSAPAQLALCRQTAEDQLSLLGSKEMRLFELHRHLDSMGPEDPRLKEQAELPSGVWPDGETLQERQLELVKSGVASASKDLRLEEQGRKIEGLEAEVFARAARGREQDHHVETLHSELADKDVLLKEQHRRVEQLEADISQLLDASQLKTKGTDSASSSNENDTVEALLSESSMIENDTVEAGGMVAATMLEQHQQEVETPAEPRQEVETEAGPHSVRQKVTSVLRALRERATMLYDMVTSGLRALREKATMLYDKDQSNGLFLRSMLGIVSVLVFVISWRCGFIARVRRCLAKLRPAGPSSVVDGVPCGKGQTVASSTVSLEDEASRMLQKARELRSMEAEELLDMLTEQVKGEKHRAGLSKKWQVDAPRN